jgi:hypothetical protein
VFVPFGGAAMRIVNRTETRLVLADDFGTYRAITLFGFVLAFAGLLWPFLSGWGIGAWVGGAVVSVLGAAAALFYERRTCVIDRVSGSVEIRRSRTIGTVIVSVPLSEVTGAKFVEWKSDDTTWLDVILVRGDEGETVLGRFEGSEEEIRTALDALGLKTSG